MSPFSNKLARCLFLVINTCKYFSRFNLLITNAVARPLLAPFLIRYATLCFYLRDNGIFPHQSDKVPFEIFVSTILHISVYVFPDLRRAIIFDFK